MSCKGVLRQRRQKLPIPFAARRWQWAGRPPARSPLPGRDPRGCLGWPSCARIARSNGMPKGQVSEREGDGTAVGQMGFGGLVRACRERGLLSQEQLAERSGLSTRAIRDLEAGRVRRPRTESVRLLVDALGLVGADRERFERAARQPPLAGQPAVQPPSPSPDAAALSQLPPAAADFVGRAELASRLQQLLAGQLDGMAWEPDAAPVIVCVVAGKAGVGKSALAVHVAHQLVADFSDGQLYASLRGGAGPGTSPLDPAEILGRFLRALGVNGDA